jgi:2-dehydropantoate 2-reductase
MKTLILGGGAVGSTLGGHLARDGRDVTIADGWFQHVDAMKQNGLKVQTVEGDFTVRLLSMLAREHLSESTIVMSSQNGMNDSVVGEWVGQERMVACVVALAADLIDPGVVKRTSPAEVAGVVFGHLAPGRDRAVLDRLKQHFEPLGVVSVADDAWPDRWGKLTLNTMSNALAGLTGLWSDTLWSDPFTLDIMTALGHETAAVAAASGVESSPVLGRISHRLLLDATSVSTPAWADIGAQMSAISAGRVGKKANRASLLQDIMKGRRTEVDYLNGWVSAEGKARGVPTPTHDQLVRELKSVERGTRPADRENARDLADAVSRWYA